MYLLLLFFLIVFEEENKGQQRRGGRDDDLTMMKCIAWCGGSIMVGEYAEERLLQQD